MKLNNISATAINLSNKPPSTIIRSLKKGDEVMWEGQHYVIAVSPKKYQRGIWLLGLIHKEKGEQQYVKVFEDTKPNMTGHEKKVYVTNITEVVSQWGEDEERMLRFIQQYHWNLSELNRFALEDVRKVMSLFPVKLLKKSGIIL